MTVLWQALGQVVESANDVSVGVPEPMPEVDPAMASAFQKAVSRVRSAGLPVRPVDVGNMLGRLPEAANTVMFYEGARFHEQRFSEFGDRLADLADLVREGLRISTQRYDETRRYIDSCKTQFAELFKATSVILTPAAVGPAPLGFAYTGDTRMNAPWTALGVPAISFPMPVGSGLPLGLQLTADQAQEARLIRTAAKVEKLLRES
jgi:Asp-tRNA(Asn)/Glu-tRNA(Gln) amidotransferase A subunit family amidase